jgi:PAS domain S-box-containing protein
MSSKRPAGEGPIGSSTKPEFTNLRSPELAPYWLTALIESADDAIISKTLEGIITSWNKGAERIFGYTADEVIGQPVTILIPEGQEDEEPAILARLSAGERIEHYETIRLRKDGTRIDISLTVSPIKGPNGDIIGASKIARDITEQRQARKELDEAYRQAEESSRLKEEFLATISHELRTPLSAILGWARMLRLGQLSKENAAKALDTIERNARAQAQLIDDLLDVSRIVTGKLRMDVRPSDPNSFIDAAVEAVRPGSGSEGRAPAKSDRHRTDFDSWRSGQTSTGDLEPAFECDQVHATWWSCPDQIGTSEFTSRDRRQRHWPGHFT